MENQSFDGIDSKISEKLKAVRETKVPGEILKNFSANVEEGIGKKSIRAGFSWKFGGSWAMAGVPAFAVLVMASLVIFQSPAFHAPAPIMELAQLDKTQASDEEMMAAMVDSMADEDVSLDDLDDETLASLEVS